MKQHAFLYRLIRFIFKPLFIFVYRPKIIGKENIPLNGNIVIAGNHKHALDPILIDLCTKRIVRTLAKKELHDAPFGFIFRGVKTIPVDLHSKTNSDALSSAVEALNSGYAVNVSPEAKRNYTNHLLLKFKYGAVSMAKKTNSPIIPYAISGDYKLFSKNLTIIFGQPLSVSEDLYEANKLLYNTISDLLISITDKKILNNKILTQFDDWEKNNDIKTS